MEQRPHEIAAAEIVSEIAEKLFSERVISQVLDQTPAVCVGVRFLQLIVRGRGVFLEDQRPYVLVPDKIDQLQVGESGVSGEKARREQGGKSPERKNVVIAQSEQRSSAYTNHRVLSLKLKHAIDFHGNPHRQCKNTDSTSRRQPVRPKQC